MYTICSFIYLLCPYYVLNADLRVALISIRHGSCPQGVNVLGEDSEQVLLIGQLLAVGLYFSTYRITLRGSVCSSLAIYSIKSEEKEEAQEECFFRCSKAQQLNHRSTVPIVIHKLIVIGSGIAEIQIRSYRFLRKINITTLRYGKV